MELENRSPPSKSAWSPPMSKLHSKAAADAELEEIMMLSAGWIAAGIPQTALQNPILLVALPVKKATELVARKARTTHVHTTVARCSHSNTRASAAVRRTHSGFPNL